MKKMYFRVLAIVLAVAMVLPVSLQAGYAAASASDIKGHWAEQDFTAWYGKGLITAGEDGSFEPDAPIMRAEFAALINKVFNLQAEADISFNDVQASAPYFSDLMKAVANGYMNGYSDNTMKPYASVSRQEAAVILYRAFQLSSSEEVSANSTQSSSKLSDVAMLPQWSRSAVTAMVDSGYIKGYSDGTFKPQRSITRAEALRLISSISGEMLVKSGTYKNLSNRNAVVNTGKIFIENSQFSGDVYVTEGVAEGEIGFAQTNVLGTLYVAGGGANSVTLNDSSVERIVVDKKNGIVRIVLGGSSTAGDVLVQSDVRLAAEADSEIGSVIIDEDIPQGAVIELIGSFKNVEVRSPHKPTIKLNGTIGTLSGLAAQVVEVETGKPEPTVTPTSTATPPVTTEPEPSGSPQPSQSPVPDLTEPPVFRNDSVHDPSIIYADGMYYVFGSHLAAAKSEDLMKWTTFASGVNAENPLFDNVLVDLQEAFQWAEIEGLWAADVIELNGKYYMYYNACRGDAPISALGIAVADHIEGPYVNQGIILKSGKGQAPLNNRSYNANIHPNAIDPDLFFDEHGKLWMVYGSYSGGIFIMEMDAETGLPIAYESSTLNSENDGYGRKLMGGNHARMEAPYIQYVPESGYYYLYVTFGGLDSTGGYNMRVSRSLTPEGPYYDAEGNNMLLAAGKAGAGLEGNDPNIAPYGVKQLGNFVFSNLDGAANYPSYGYVSAGHNSTYYDEQTGKLFNIFHSRFPGRGEQHEIRVHQMWINEAGWPVMAPHRYVGETIRAVKQEEIVGPYHFVNHGKEITKNITSTSYIELLANGQIAGSATGTWELTGARGYDVKITLVENGQELEYEGVFARLWDSTREQYVMSFSASSAQGATVWGSRLADMDDEQIVQTASAGLAIGDVDRVYENLMLVTEGARGSVIQWESSNENIVQGDGTVHRPAYGSGNADVTLTATVKKGTATATKTFELTVMEQAQNPLLEGMVAHYAFENDLADHVDSSKSGTVTGDRINNSGGSIGYSNGVAGQAAAFNGQSGVRLPDGLVASSSYSVSLWLKPEQLTNFTTTFFGAVPIANSDGYEYVSVVPQHGYWNNMVVWGYQSDGVTGGHYDALSATTIPLDQWTQVVYTVEEGVVNVYVNGSLKFTGAGFPNPFEGDNGQFALGVNYWDVPYKGQIDELRVYEIAISPEQIAGQYAQDTANVWDVKLNASSSSLLAGTTASLSATVLPVSAGNKQLQWSSSDESVATVVNGVVTAVAAGEAIITASSVQDPSKRAQVSINVTAQVVEVEAIELAAEQIQLRGGAYTPGNIVVLPANATIKALSWSIDNSEVAEIDAVTGKVTAKSAGSATVTAYATDGSGVSASYTLIVNYDGLVAHYSFEDDLANGSDTAFGAGTVVGSKLGEAGGSIDYKQGIAGKAANFNGQSGVQLPNGLIADNTYTVSFWLKPEQLTQFTTTFFGAAAPNSWISFSPYGHNDVGGNAMLWSGEAWFLSNSGSRITAGDWVHVAFTVDQGDVRVYINGVEKFNGNQFPNVFTNDNAVFALGVNYWDTPYKGLLDELRVYNEALSAEEVSYLAAESL